MSWIKVIILILNTAISIFALYLCMGAKDYENLLEPLQGNDFPLKEIYGIGLKWDVKRNYPFVSKEDKKFRKEICLLYGGKYAEYYLRIVHARRFSLSLLCLALFSNMACLASGTDTVVMLAVGCAIAGAVYYCYTTWNAEQIRKQTELYVRDFPDVLSKLALLINAGMVLREAWDKVAFSKNEPLYVQMQITSSEIRNGRPDMQAYYSFGLRTVSGDIRKFSSMIIQGVEKGNKELAYALADFSSEMWQIRKQNVMRQGALASGKLIVPMMIMFIGILVMVLVPIFSNLGL